MKPFFSTRAKRSTAFVALALWLFAVASGIANACLLEARGPHSHDAAGTDATASDEPHERSEEHAAAHAGHDADSDESKAPCLKVCDDGTHALLNRLPGIDLTNPGQVPFVSVVWTATAPVVCAPSRGPELRPPDRGPPIRVRFSRLTL